MLMYTYTYMYIYILSHSKLPQGKFLHRDSPKDMYIMNTDYTIITQWHDAESFLGLLFYSKINQKGILALFFVIS